MTVGAVAHPASNSTRLIAKILFKLTVHLFRGHVRKPPFDLANGGRSLRHLGEGLGNRSVLAFLDHLVLVKPAKYQVGQLHESKDQADPTHGLAASLRLGSLMAAESLALSTLGMAET